jgi:hypothetical protein
MKFESSYPQFKKKLSSTWNYPDVYKKFKNSVTNIVFLLNILYCETTLSEIFSILHVCLDLSRNWAYDSYILTYRLLHNDTRVNWITTPCCATTALIP